MARDELQAPQLALQVVYADLPDLIQVGTRVRSGGWSGIARVYTSPDLLRDSSHALMKWARHPASEFIFEAGATDIGWLHVRFREIDLAGHLRCSIQLSTDARFGDVWRMSLWPASLEMIQEL